MLLCNVEVWKFLWFLNEDAGVRDTVLVILKRVRAVVYFRDFWDSRAADGAMYRDPMGKR